MMHSFVRCRYGPDDPDHYGLRGSLRPEPPRGEDFYRHMLSSALRITPELFPQLAAALDGINGAIGLDRPMQSFVMPDPTMQAYCYSHKGGSDATFTIIIHSGLIEKLLPEELRFVMGHEVGHFLCEHWRYPSEDAFNTEGQKLAALQLHRASEISADRVGLLAASSLEIACSAMIKTAAGLGAPHLRPDISSILSQFRELSDQQGHAGSIWATHPIIPLRIRALLWFDRVAAFFRSGAQPTAEDMEKIDAAVAQDFGKSSGFALEKIQDERLRKVRMWALTAIFAADGVLSKLEQEVLGSSLGPEVSAQIMGFLSAATGDVRILTERKAQIACSEASSASAAKRNALAEDLRRIVRDSAAYNAEGEQLLSKVCEWLKASEP